MQLRAAQFGFVQDTDGRMCIPAGSNRDALNAALEASDFEGEFRRINDALIRGRDPDADAAAAAPVTPDPAPARWATCYHEAGHAVVAHALGSRITKVSTIRNEKENGAVFHAGAGDFENACVALAGGEAEWRRFGATLPGYSARHARDRVEIQTALTRLHGYDPKQVLMSWSQVECSPIGAKVRARVDELLTKNWLAVHGLAAALKCYRTLDGEAVSAILDGNEGVPSMRQAEELDGVADDDASTERADIARQLVARAM
jgi:hypothetical protein